MRLASTSSTGRLAEGVAVLLLTGAAVAEVTADPGRTGPLPLHVSVVVLLGAVLLLRLRLRAGAPVLGGAAVVVQSAVGFAASAGELVLYLLLVGTAAATRPPRDRALALAAVTGGFLAVLLADPATETLRSGAGDGHVRGGRRRRHGSSPTRMRCGRWFPGSGS